MKKFLIILLIGIAIAFVAYISVPRYIFRTHLISPIPEWVYDIDLSTVRGGMHPPRIISFNSKKNMTEDLRFNLQIESPPVRMPQILKEYPGLKPTFAIIQGNDYCRINLEMSTVLVKEEKYESRTQRIIFIFISDSRYCYLRVPL